MPIISGGSSGSGGSSLTTYRKNTSKVVSGTTGATDLLNGEITIGANKLGATSILKMSMRGDWKQNSGGTADSPRFQVILGGSTIIDTGTPTIAIFNSASRKSWRAELEIANQNATNSQWVSLWIYMGGLVTAGMNAAAPTTGEGFWGCVLSTTTSSAFLAAEIGNTGAVDMTSARSLVFNVINASSSANYDVTLFNALAVIF